MLPSVEHGDEEARSHDLVEGLIASRPGVPTLSKRLEPKVLPSGQDAEAPGVVELEVGMLLTDLLPEDVDADVGIAADGDVEENDAFRRELWQPFLEVGRRTR